MLARRPLHEVRLRVLALERDRRRDVDEQLHPQDLDRQQRLAEPGDRRDEDEPEQRDVGRDEEDQALLHVVDDAPALAQAVHQRGERVVAEDEVGRLLRDRRPRAHRDRDVGAAERRGVVDAVAGDGDRPAALARDADEPLLLIGRRAGDDAHPRQLVARAGRRPTPRSRRRRRCAPRPARPRGRSRPPSAGGRRSRRSSGCRPRPRSASASRIPSRSGSANPMSARIAHGGVVGAGRARPTSRSPLDGARRRAAPPTARWSVSASPARARMASGAPIATATSGPSRRRIVELYGRPSATGTDGDELAAGRASRPRPRRSTARISERVNEPGCAPSPVAQASSSARSASSRTASRRVGVGRPVRRASGSRRPRAGSGSACRSCR